MCLLFRDGGAKDVDALENRSGADELATQTFLTLHSFTIHIHTSVSYELLTSYESLL